MFMYQAEVLLLSYRCAVPAAKALAGGVALFYVHIAIKQIKNIQ